MVFEVRTKRVIFGVAGWGLRYERQTVRWVAQIGPFYVIRKGLPFDREAAGRLFAALHSGPVGSFARSRRERP